MNKWVVEDWKFELTAVEGKAGNCRLGLEKRMSCGNVSQGNDASVYVV